MPSGSGINLSPKASTTHSALWPFALAYACNGGIVSMTGANLLAFFALTGWSPATFGTALLVQGSFAYLGIRFLCPWMMAKWPGPVRLALSCLMQFAGLLLVYGPDLGGGSLRWAGFACVGLSVGTLSLFGSWAGLESAEPQKNLNLLNLAFTGGAVVVPLLSTLLKFTPSLDWRSPLLILLAAHACLWSRAIAQGVRSTGESRAAHALRHASGVGAMAKITTLHSLGLAASCFALFLYVGTEINFSNAWVGLVNTQSSLGTWASPLFWGGLFLSRLTFSLFVPAQSKLPSWLVGFGAGTLLSLGLFGGLVNLGGPELHLSLHLSLLPAFTSGFCIGSTYSFVIGAVTSLAPKGFESAYAAKTSEWGVLGAIALPPLIGLFQQKWGIEGAFWFLVGSVGLFLVSTMGMLANATKSRISNPALYQPKSSSK